MILKKISTMTTVKTLEDKFVEAVRAENIETIKGLLEFGGIKTDTVRNSLKHLKTSVEIAAYLIGKGGDVFSEPSTTPVDRVAAPNSGLQELEQSHAEVYNDSSSDADSDVSSRKSPDSPTSEYLQEEAHQDSFGALTHAFKSLDFRSKHDKDFDKRIDAMVKEEQEREENRWW